MWGIRDDGDALVIGGMTTHYEVMTSDLVQRHCGLLGEATSTVADPQVRHRGTFGGALSHADPAGDLPAVALAYGATSAMACRRAVRARSGSGGSRQIPGPVIRMAPNPSRFTTRSPPTATVPAAFALG